MQTQHPFQSGLVVASFGRHFLVESPNGERRICHPRGKKSEAVVGDEVLWQASGDEGRIEKIQERRNLLWRQDEIRSKSFAANIDQALILLAAEPEFSEQQLARALIACHAAKIQAVIALNKRDLSAAFERAWQRLAVYRQMGEQVLPLCIKHDFAKDRAQVLALLEGKTTLVLGPSGVGKSSLINQLIPLAKLQTQEISTALNSGKHTTTSTTLHWLDAARNSALIDSPGFQEFGLHHLAAQDLAGYMPDFSRHLGSCRFYNCTHLHEPGCNIISKLELAENQDRISRKRYEIYSKLFAELAASS